MKSSYVLMLYLVLVLEYLNRGDSEDGGPCLTLNRTSDKRVKFVFRPATVYTAVYQPQMEGEISISTDIFADERWNHIAFVRDFRRKRNIFYLNGEKKKSLT